MKTFLSYRLNIILMSLFLLFSKNVLSQSPSFGIITPTLCFAPGSNTTTAIITNTVATATSYSWIVSGPCTPTWTTIGTGTQINISYPCCGTYTYVCMAMAGTSLVASSFTLATVYCTPTVQISGNMVVCSGLSTTLQASGATSYTWYPSLINSPSIIISPSVITSYTLIGDNGNCTNMAATSVSVALPPSLTITASSNTICAGNTVTLTATGASSYLWVNSGSTLSSFTVNLSSTVNYTLIGTSSPSCTSAAQKSISVIAPGSINAFSTHSFVCPGNAATLTAAGANSYTWAGGPLTSTYVIHPFVSTIYTVNGYNGPCLVNGTVMVIVNPVPVISVQPSGANTLCAGSNTVLSATGAQSYTWSTGANSSSISVTPTANTVYTVLGSNSSGCIDTAYTSFFVPPALSPNFSYSQGLNGQINFSNTSTNTLVSTSYSWSFGNGQSSTLQTPSATYTSNGIYFVTLTANNGCGPASITNTVFVSSLGGGCAAGFSVTPGLGGNYSFTSTSAGTNTTTLFLWNFGNGSPTYSAMSSAGTNPPAQTYQSGTYTVTLQILNFNPFCSDSISMVIHVCAEHSQFSKVALSNTTYSFSSTSTGTSSATSFTWNYGDGATGTGSTSIHTYTAAGIYSVTLYATSGSSCGSTSLGTVNVGACSLSSNFTHTITTNGLVNFSNISTYSSSVLVYPKWDFGDGTFSYANNPTHTFFNAGTYNVTLILEDSTGFCKDTLTQSINVTGISCIAYSNFTILPTNTPQYWDAQPGYPWNVTAANWSWGDGTNTDSLYASHTYSAAGNYSICLSVTVNCGSSSSYCYSYLLNKSDAENSQMVHINVLPPEKSTGLAILAANNLAFTLYPNPSNGEFTLNAADFKNNKILISVYSFFGEKVFSSDTVGSDEAQTVSLMHVAEGIYFVRLQSGNNSHTEKIIIAR